MENENINIALSNLFLVFTLKSKTNFIKNSERLRLYSDWQI